MRDEFVYPAGQRGMALVLSLIFLAIVTLVSLSSMQGSMIQGRMAANQQDYTVALQAAEDALSKAERWLKDAAHPPSRQVCEPAPSSGLSREASYCIEPIAPLGSRATSEGVEMLEILYRIEAEGTGQSKDTKVNLEALFVREQRAGT
ncbi:pilus assembly PilX family protein [Vreelandella sp. EE22]